jgi:hypothetical protein
VLLILLHKVGSFLHVPVPLAEVIGAVVEAANRRIFSDVSSFFFSSLDGYSHLHRMNLGSSGLGDGMIDFQC